MDESKGGIEPLFPLRFALGLSLAGLMRAWVSPRCAAHCREDKVSNGYALASNCTE
jgi:hypothetical protein